MRFAKKEWFKAIGGGGGGWFVGVEGCEGVEEREGCEGCDNSGEGWGVN